MTSSTQAPPIDLGGLATLREGARSRRAASWDRSGGNRYGRGLAPGETQVLLDVEGPGCITRIYMATPRMPIDWLRDTILRCHWDGEEAPSVEVPIGDFFLLGHARYRPLQSALVAVNPGLGWGYGVNAWFPMPFSRSARITLENRGTLPCGYLEHIDYEVYDRPLGDDTLRFHAQYRQARPTVPAVTTPGDPMFEGVNLSGRDNFVALEARGNGQMVGLHLQVENPHAGWWGEGSDMVWIDEEGWPPTLHGTGTEELFGLGPCPPGESTGLYSGWHLVENADWSGLSAMYRFFVNDPIRFTQSLRWTIEHGHANNFASGYASVAYWYQDEPHLPFPGLPSREAMLPAHGVGYDEATRAFFPALDRVLGRWVQAARDPAVLREVVPQMLIGEAYMRGDWQRTLRLLAEAGLTS